MERQKYEQVMLEQFKRDKQIADNELAVTARKFLKGEELNIIYGMVQDQDKKQ